MIRGFVEVVGPLQIRGWAVRTASPDDLVEVVATVAGRQVAFGHADVARSDLSTAGFGGGQHGFIINLDEALDDAEQALLAIHTTDESGLPAVLPRLKAKPPAPRPPPRIDRAADTAGRRHEVEDNAHWPIFVLGAARSGTSALAQGLLGATRYVGHEEGHLLDLLSEMAKTIRDHYEQRGEEWSERATMISSVPQSYLQDRLRSVFVDLARQLFPAGRWIDKTPRVSMITAAVELRKIWPNARFVYMRRRGLENIRSRMSKFPTLSFEAHCVDWRDSLAEWQRVRSALTGAAIEVDQILMAREPERVAGEVGALLDLTDAERTRFAAWLHNERPERQSVDFERSPSIDMIGWTDRQRETFAAVCGDTMRSFGYAETERYFLDGGSSNALRRY